MTQGSTCATVTRLGLGDRRVYSTPPATATGGRYRSLICSGPRGGANTSCRCNVSSYFSERNPTVAYTPQPGVRVLLGLARERERKSREAVCDTMEGHRS